MSPESGSTPRPTMLNSPSALALSEWYSARAASSSWRACQSGSNPSNVGTTRWASIRVAGLSMCGPNNGAKRRTMTRVSGWRSRKVRTCFSTSTLSVT